MIYNGLSSNLGKYIMDKNHNIIIIGAGISGLSAAIALKQKGFKVTIYERHKSVQTIGAGIVLWSNASYILNKLNLLEAVKKVSSKPKNMQRFSDNGEALGSLNIEIINNEIGFESYAILREDFQQILMDKLAKLDVKINYKYKVVDIITINEKAHIIFKNTKSITADIILGTDGRMNSQARKYIFGENRPKYQSFINWIGIYKSKEKLFESMDILDYWGVGERFGIVPIDAYSCYWAGGVFSEDIHTKEPLKYKEELMVHFKNYPSIVSKVIQESLLKYINKLYLHDHEPVNIWHKNNLIMLGDAAHAALPTSGQGSSQALEDAWHFSNILSKHSLNSELIFKEFREKRYKKTTSIIQSGRALAFSIFNKNEVYCLHRNEESKKSDFTIFAKSMALSWGEGLY